MTNCVISQKEEEREEKQTVLQKNAEKGLGSFTGKASKGKLDTKSKRK